MRKKNIILSAIGLVLFVCIGFGFYSVFSNAKSSEVATKNGEVVAANKTAETEVDKAKDKIDEKGTEKVEEEDNTEKVDEENSSEKLDENKTDKKEEKSPSSQVSSNESDADKKEPNTDTTSKPAVDKPQTEKPSVEKPSEDKPQTEKPQPEKPKPESPAPEPQKNTVTVSINCQTAINNGVNKNPGFEHLPSNGVILGTVNVEFNEGDTVFNILQKVTRQNRIHMEYRGSGSTIYIEGINNLYEFDGGEQSGWMYNVNGWYPNYGAGSYNVKNGDVIQWNYTCDLGKDLGAGWKEQ